MKQLIKRNLGNLLHPLVTKLGYQRHSPQPDRNLLDEFFSVLQQINFNPHHIIDVGANHGNWTRQSLRYFPDALYSLLEPQKWLEANVADLLKMNPRVKFHPVGAGSVQGSFKFTLLHRDDSSTFILSEDEAKKMGLKQIDVEVVALSDFIAKHKLPCPDIIKIDAEGLDLEVLEGARDYFGKTEIFIVEAAVVSKYIKNDVASVIDFMKKSGYKLFEITDLNRPFIPRVLWLLELVFVRENGFIDSKSIVQYHK